MSNRLFARAPRKNVSNNRAITRFVAITAALALVVGGALATTPDDAAFAKTKYPSWSDVQKARKSESATKKQIANIRALISSLNGQVEQTQKVAEEKGNEYQIADQAFQEAVLKADELQSQADAANALATESIERAGEMAARLYRSGNTDFSTNLLVNASEAEDMLYSYGMANKFSEQAEGVYDTATQDENTAQALTDQADVARDLLEDLQVKAQKALEEATTAANAAAAALEEQQANNALLTAQLDVLVSRRKATEKDYLKGVREANKGGASLGAGQISSSGWARPAGGYITSSFGYRVDPFTGGSSYHLGTDLGNACGTAIFAAHAGTVSYSGTNGVYGQFIRIDHGNGQQTEYGHIQNGGRLVSTGQKVGVGQQIAKVGATGAATGCHLHFGVRVNGLVTDPVPFMKSRGVRLG